MIYDFNNFINLSLFLFQSEKLFLFGIYRDLSIGSLAVIIAVIPFAADIVLNFKVIIFKSVNPNQSPISEDRCKFLVYTFDRFW